MASNINLLPDLPPEIIEFQILSRLPVKSLLRFQSVCKPWKLLISSNPYFVKTHLGNSNYNSIILRRRESIFMTDFEYYFELYEHSKIIGCINGLVCFFNWRTGCLKELVSAIWNPATKQCVVIPALTDKSAVTPYCVGFGFDSVSNDYKVVYVTTIKGQPLVGFIYSYNLDRWKKIAPSNFLYHGTLRNSNRPAIVKGCIYWLNLQVDGLTVISFDVGHKVFRLLPGSFDKKRGKDVVLVNMRDSVAVIFYDRTLSLWSTIHVHIFNEGSCGEWSNMSIGPFIGQEPTCILAHYKLLTCFPNGDILFAGPDLELYCVSPEMHTIKSLKSPEKKGINKGNYYYDGCIFSESLISLQGMEKPWYHDHHEVEVFSLEED